MIGAPEKSEVAAYYFIYIDQVKGPDIRAVLSDQLDEALESFSQISEEKSQFRYAPDKWSIRQVLNHISDTERVFAFRAWWFARAFDSPLPGMDQNVAAAGAGADNVSWAAHTEEFRRIRSSTLSLFANMPSGGWMRTGIASDNPFTVRALAWIIAGHYAHHARVLRERYL